MPGAIIPKKFPDNRKRSKKGTVARIRQPLTTCLK
jgi:hypothetical protein